jgi:hypothetical protein
MKGCGLFLFGRLSHVCGFQQGSIADFHRHRPPQISGFQRLKAAEDITGLWVSLLPLIAGLSSISDVGQPNVSRCLWQINVATAWQSTPRGEFILCSVPMPHVSYARHQELINCIVAWILLPDFSTRIYYPGISTTKSYPRFLAAQSMSAYHNRETKRELRRRFSLSCSRGSNNRGASSCMPNYIFLSGDSTFDYDITCNYVRR